MEMLPVLKMYVGVSLVVAVVAASLDANGRTIFERGATGVLAGAGWLPGLVLFTTLGILGGLGCILRRIYLVFGGWSGEEA